MRDDNEVEVREKEEGGKEKGELFRGSSKREIAYGTLLLGIRTQQERYITSYTVLRMTGLLLLFWQVSFEWLVGCPCRYLHE